MVSMTTDTTELGKDTLARYRRKLAKAGDDQEQVEDVLREMKEEASLLGRTSSALFGLHDALRKLGAGHWPK